MPSAHSSSTIQSQIRLPLSIAVEVVLRGIRIRMGRSLVTMMGVVFGVAFFMSVLATGALREGMAEEEALRDEVNRMASFLEADLGPFPGKTIVVRAVGALDAAETRLLETISRAKPGALLFQSPQGVAPPDLPEVEVLAATATPPEQTDAVLLAGSATPADADGRASPGMPPNASVILASTRPELAVATAGAVNLRKPPTEEQLERRAAEAAQARVRNIWVITISLLVTVIGVSNALLMSVTERFREIGTMKCLGALSSFIRRIFLIESALIGLSGSLLGGLLGFLVAALLYMLTFGPGLVLSALNPLQMLGLYGISLLCGLVLSVAAAIYPAQFASRMVPASALRSNI